MKTLLKNGKVINVFTDSLESTNVLLEDDRIIGVGAYCDEDADAVVDLDGRYLCPGFIDGHIHIESTMLTPAELARACVPHGTTSIVADPHEIANVCGTLGIEYVLEASEGIPMNVYMMLPSCVPATPLDEAGAVLEAEDLKPFYQHPRVLGLGEMMNYTGVIHKDPQVLEKIKDARSEGHLVNGHAPLLTGKMLDQYIGAGITDDHECTDIKEAMERIRKGQRVMIRQGTAARNLEALLPLFEEPWSRRCLLVTDDRHPADILEEGHIDHIIRMAVSAGKSVFTGIRMATIQAAEYFGLKGVGAVAPGYTADLLVLEDLDRVKVRDVYRAGKKVVSLGQIISFADPQVRPDVQKAVRNSFYVEELTAEEFHISPEEGPCRVIRLIENQLLTDEWITEIDFRRNNGVDIDRDILKLAVIERHLHTGHKGIGFINGVGLQKGAIASSVSHDSHNLIVIGTNGQDMAVAANRIREIGGGNVVVSEGRILAEMSLPVAGLMSEQSARELAKQNLAVRKAVHELGAREEIEPFMNMAFLSLPVIPSLKMTTRGLVNVEKQCFVPLFAGR